MSFRLRRVELENFRKFRSPFVLEGLTDGLNIVVEPNETGKSTLLEALRAGLFVRHSTSNALASSYRPHGDRVGPQVIIDFEVGDEPWRVSKRFLQSQRVELRGPNATYQSDAAETKLQELLGFERDTSRGGSNEARGALGLLWVEQASALEVQAPGRMVRDTVRGALEGEVGAILGGKTFDAVSAKVAADLGALVTRTGQPRLEYTAAVARVTDAEAALTAASLRLGEFEELLGELETARATLRIVTRDLNDETDAETRADLVAKQEVARTATVVLESKRAEHAAAKAQADALTDLQKRYDDATARRTKGGDASTKARVAKEAFDDKLRTARSAEDDARKELTAARKAAKLAGKALAAGREQLSIQERETGLRAARERFERLRALEADRMTQRAIGGKLIGKKAIDELVEYDRAVIVAQAAVTAGSTEVDIALTASIEVTVDGSTTDARQLWLVKPTVIALGTIGTVTVRPPAGLSTAHASLTRASSALHDALAKLDVADLAEARRRNEEATAAVAAVKLLDQRIATLCFADERIDLVAGADALKALVAALPEGGNEEDRPDPVDLPALEAADRRERDEVARLDGVSEHLVENLREVEGRAAPLLAACTSAERDVAHAQADHDALLADPRFKGLEADLREARETSARAAGRLAEAEANAKVHEPAQLAKHIAAIDLRRAVAEGQRVALLQQIAKLETKVETEGPKGLGDREAAAHEEVSAAREARERLSTEVETLGLLDLVLREASAQTSRTFLAPVARRAKRHIQRILPNCDLSFTDELALSGITRDGVSEGCDDLSKGTQEQLAVLTRLAFADMLLDQGAPVSLILDDPLVYADDVRLDSMTDILMEASERMQVILLTCRARAFRHVAGTRITMRQ